MSEKQNISLKVHEDTLFLTYDDHIVPADLFYDTFSAAYETCYIALFITYLGIA